MNTSPEYYQEIASKKRDYPALIIHSQSSTVVYTHFGTGPKYNEVFKEFENFHDQKLGSSLLASLTDNDRTSLQNWLDILYDETYVELMMPEDIVKLCPSFSLTWTDGQNYEVRFEAIKTETVYEYVLVWLEPHGQTQQQRLASEIIELMRELRNSPKEVINNLKEYLPEVEAQINLKSYADVDDSEEFISQLSRHLHSIKGTTFFLGFTTIGNACHDAESKLEELKGHWDLSQGIQPIRDILSQLSLLVNLAEGISTKVYNTSEESEAGNLTIAQTDYYDAINTAGDLFESSKSIARKEKKFFGLVDKLYHSLIRFDAMGINNLFERLHSSTSQLAKELEKSVMFSLAPNPPTVYLPHRLFDSLWNALYQVLKNAIDHGLEPSEVRETKGKPSFAEILFSVAVEADHLLMCLKDDGQGISPQATIQTALEKKMITQKEAKRLEKSSSQEEIFQLIFSPGFSTQRTVTTISGRGMGTDVIRKEVESYSGTIKVESEVGQWTTFTLSVPIAQNHIVVEEDA